MESKSPIKSVSAVISFGPPAGGKSNHNLTIARWLTSMGHTVHKVSLSSMMRERGGDIPFVQHIVRDLMARGGLIPDSLAFACISYEIIRSLGHHKEIGGDHTLLIDGFPRTMGQALMLAPLLTQLGCDPVVNVWFHATKSVCAKRYHRDGREDNGKFPERWADYVGMTVPAYHMFEKIFSGGMVNTQLLQDVAENHLRQLLSTFFPALSSPPQHTD